MRNLRPANHASMPSDLIYLLVPGSIFNNLDLTLFLTSGYIHSFPATLLSVSVSGPCGSQAGRGVCGLLPPFIRKTPICTELMPGVVAAVV